MFSYNKEREKYGLDRKLYTQTVNYIQRYYALKQQYLEAMSKAIEQDGMPKATRISDPTGSEAITRASISSQIAPIEKAMEKIPEEYRKGVWERLQYKKPYPLDASEWTYNVYRRRYVYWVAFYAGWVVRV